MDETLHVLNAGNGSTVWQKRQRKEHYTVPTHLHDGWRPAVDELLVPAFSILSFSLSETEESWCSSHFISMILSMFWY